MEFGTCGRVIAVPRVVPLMGNNFTCGLASVPELHVPAAVGSVQVTYAVALVLAVPVIVPVTRLLVTVACVPMLQLSGRQEAEMPTVPGETEVTLPIPLTLATAGWVAFQVNEGRVVS